MCFTCYISSKDMLVFIIQQIVTMPIYGKEALNICHPYMTDIKQLLDEVEQNIVICQWRADQLFADAEGRGK